MKKHLLKTVLALLALNIGFACTSVKETAEKKRGCLESVTFLDRTVIKVNRFIDDQDRIHTDSVVYRDGRILAKYRDGKQIKYPYTDKD